jgi:hypothetical protein
VYALLYVFYMPIYAAVFWSAAYLYSFSLALNLKYYHDLITGMNMEWGKQVYHIKRLTDSKVRELQNSFRASLACDSNTHRTRQCMHEQGRWSTFMWPEEMNQLRCLVRKQWAVTSSLDAFAGSIALYAFVFVVLSMPINILGLYLIIYLKSEPHLHNVAITGSGTVVTLWLLIFLSGATVNHKTKLAYKHLNFILCRVNSYSVTSLQVKQSMLNLIEMIAANHIGIRCLNIFMFTYDFCVTFMLEFACHYLLLLEAVGGGHDI